MTTTPLNTTLRREVIGLLTQKAQNVVQALEREVRADVDTLIEEAMTSQGHIPSVQLDLRLRELQRELRRLPDEDEDPILEQLAAREVLVDEQIDNEIESARAIQTASIERARSDFRLAEAGIKASRPSRLAEIEELKQARLRELEESSLPGLRSTIRQLESELSESKARESSIRVEMRARAQLIDKSRSRLVHLVNDAVADARVKLLTCATTEDANVLLERIPTVAEVIHLAESPELGLDALISRLHPSHQIRVAPALPAPDQERTDD